MPTQTHTRTPKPKAGSVVIVYPSYYGPTVFRQENTRGALCLMARWNASQCMSGSESVWVYEKREWVAIGSLTGL